MSKTEISNFGVSVRLLIMMVICFGVFFSSCDSYQKTFNNDKPLEDFSVVDSIAFQKDDFFVLGICEDYILYKYPEQQNGVALTITEEVPVKAYYNKGGENVCESCLMVEETYLYLEGVCSDIRKNGRAFYMPSYRTFIRQHYDSASRYVVLERDKVSPRERGEDIGRFLDHPTEMNFTVVRDVMAGQWWTPNPNVPDSIYIILPSESGAGYFMIGAHVSDNDVIFDQISNPTIDQYAPQSFNTNYMMPIKGAIQLENDKNGLTFYHLPDQRKVKAGYVEKHDVEALVLKENKHKKELSYSFELACRREGKPQQKYFWKREKRLSVVR